MATYMTCNNRAVPCARFSDSSLLCAEALSCKPQNDSACGFTGELSLQWATMCYPGMLNCSDAAITYRLLPVFRDTSMWGRVEAAQDSVCTSAAPYFVSHECITKYLQRPVSERAPWEAHLPCCPVTPSEGSWQHPLHLSEGLVGAGYRVWVTVRRGGGRAVWGRGTGCWEGGVGVSLQDCFPRAG